MTLKEARRLGAQLGDLRLPEGCWGKTHVARQQGEYLLVVTLWTCRDDIEEKLIVFPPEPGIEEWLYSEAVAKIERSWTACPKENGLQFPLDNDAPSASAPWVMETVRKLWSLEVNGESRSLAIKLVRLCEFDSIPSPRIRTLRKDAVILMFERGTSIVEVVCHANDTYEVCPRLPGVVFPVVQVRNGQYEKTKRLRLEILRYWISWLYPAKTTELEMIDLCYSGRRQ